MSTHDGFHAWTYSFRALAPYNRVALCMFRYKRTGSRFVLTRQISAALNITIAALTALMGKAGLSLYELHDPAEIQQLQDINQLGSAASNPAVVSTTKLSSIIKLLRRMDTDEEQVLPVGRLIQPLVDASRAPPPASASMLGMQRLAEAAVLEAELGDYDPEDEGFDPADYDNAAAQDDPDFEPEPEDASIPSPPFYISPPARAAMINMRVGRPRRLEMTPASTPVSNRAPGLPLVPPGTTPRRTPFAPSPTPLALRDYPTALEKVYLTDEQKSEPYGLGGAASRRVLEEVAGFVRWSESDIQLDRDARYAAAAQTTTTEKHADVIKAYLGYTVHISGDYTKDTVALAAYRAPHTFLAFISYLMGRGVGRGHILKHMSVARKVNSYLQTGTWRLCFQLLPSVNCLFEF